MTMMTGEELWALYHARKAAAKAAAAECPRKTCRAKCLLAPDASNARMTTCDRCRDLRHFYYIANLEQGD